MFRKTLLVSSFVIAMAAPFAGASATTLGQLAHPGYSTLSPEAKAEVDRIAREAAGAAGAALEKSSRDLFKEAVPENFKNLLTAQAQQFIGPDAMSRIMAITSAPALQAANTGINAAPVSSDFDAQMRSWVKSNIAFVAAAMNEHEQLERTRQEQQRLARMKTMGPEFEKVSFTATSPSGQQMSLNLPTGGNRGGDKTLVYFFDYNCSFCKRAKPMLAEITAKFPDLKIVYRDLPVLGPSSEMAARAALAVQVMAPEKYEQYHTALMTFEGQKDESALRNVAQQVGLDWSQLSVLMKDDRVNALLENTRSVAQRAEIRGTPFFFAGSQAYPGLVPASAIEGALTGQVAAR